MTDQTAELLLQEFRAFRDNEFREFRDEVNGWRQDTAERIATLEAHDKDISGNGQPGRMSRAEVRLTTMERIHWRATGIVAAIVGAMSLLSRYIPLPWVHK